MKTGTPCDDRMHLEFRQVLERSEIGS